MRQWMFDARKHNGLTMAQAAEKLGISEGYYSMIEKGQRQETLGLMLAQKLAELFGMTVQQIVDAEIQRRG